MKDPLSFLEGQEAFSSTKKKRTNPSTSLDHIFLSPCPVYGTIWWKRIVHHDETSVWRFSDVYCIEV